MDDFKELNMKNITSDFSFVKNPARIAVYDDLKAPPRIITIEPADTNDFIENLTSKIYEECQNKNSKVAYTIIRELCENFIHANFSEIVVSILDNANTIRFADQGPGFSDVNKSKLPGFTSATEEMKKYIRGVGSGLPTVNEYFQYSDGYIKIENNVDDGSVITISFLENLNNSVAFSPEEKKQSDEKYKQKISKLYPTLSNREKDVLKLFLVESPLGVTEINNSLNIPNSSIHKILLTLEQSDLVVQLPNKKRILSDLGFKVVNLL